MMARARRPREETGTVRLDTHHPVVPIAIVSIIVFFAPGARLGEAFDEGVAEASTTNV